LAHASCLQELKQALEEKGVTVGLPTWPPVLYKREDESDRRVMEDAIRLATRDLGRPPQIIFVITERGKCPLIPIVLHYTWVGK
jgi:hypothetical protein